MASNSNTLVEDWIAIWNGDYALTEQDITEDFTVHAALMDGGDALRGRDALVEWIKQLRAAFSELVFTVQVGPIVQDEQIALRWIATGNYGGGFPGATAPVGAKVEFTGTDVLRAEGEKLAEYWVNSDVHVLLAQLGVGA
jgi:predicted ester cyclase